MVGSTLDLTSSVLGENTKLTKDMVVGSILQHFINIQPSKIVKLSYQSTNQCCGIIDQFLKSSKNLTLLTRSVIYLLS